MDESKVAVAEEAAKTGEGNTDETTPAVDEKSNASPVAEKADETKDTVVVNGTKTEPAKDEKPATEPTPEPVAVPVAAIVVEEKKIEKEVTEETQKIETVVAEPKPTESLKSIVTEEPAAVTAKIEVKAESIQDDNAHKSSEADKTEIQQEIISEELIKNINDDGDSESAQNLPPPPLPCTSPPSQVSVFALGDNKDHEQQLPSPTTTFEVAQELPVAAEKSAESVGSPPAAAPITLSSEIVEEVKSDEMKRDVELNLESSIVSCKAAPTQIFVEPASPVVDAVPEVIHTEDITAALPPVDVAAIKEVVDNISPITEINPDQIAETIALIDEVTQEAVTISQHKLDETSAAINSTETESLKKEEEKIENIVTETSSNDPHPEDNSTPESTSISETNIPSDTEKSIAQVESKPEEIVQVQEIVATEDIETKSKPNEIIGDHVETQKDNIIETSVIDSEQPKETVDIVVPQTEEEPADKTETKLVDDTTPTTETEETSQVSKSKENGIGENHAAETSATESLNGQLDHKTIEEIKSDCSDKLNNEPTTELAAGTVQVKE